jgi:Na+/melibiose symporter-like transporter
VIGDFNALLEPFFAPQVHTQWTELRRFGRVAVSWMVTGAVLAAVVAIMLFFIWLEDNKKAVYAKLMWQGWPQWLLGSTVSIHLARRQL